MEPSQVGPAIFGVLLFIIWLLMMVSMFAGWILFLIAAWRAMKAHEKIASCIEAIADNKQTEQTGIEAIEQ